MNPVRVGKIARLPEPVREELNERLHRGELGRECVEWLNFLPEVQAVLARDFGGRPILAQNLSEWRHGGYRDWLAGREARRVAVELGQTALAGNSVREACPDLTDTLAFWVAARYSVDLHRVDSTEDPQARWKLLRQMTRDIVDLRRGDHRAKAMNLRSPRACRASRISSSISTRTPPQSQDQAQSLFKPNQTESNQIKPGFVAGHVAPGQFACATPGKASVPGSPEVTAAVFHGPPPPRSPEVSTAVFLPLTRQSRNHPKICSGGILTVGSFPGNSRFDTFKAPSEPRDDRRSESTEEAEGKSGRRWTGEPEEAEGTSGSPWMGEPAPLGNTPPPILPSKPGSPFARELLTFT